MITIFENSKKDFGYTFGNGPNVHSAEGFKNAQLASAYAEMELEFVRATAHEFQPRLIAHRATSGELIVTGWAHVCACGETRGAHSGNLSDRGPCAAKRRPA